ncbi:MAG: 50S ribosomal protein L4 [Chloroflexota bacterium]|nr:50S ribosomal protein L4 [Chloroflexota bacterium]
MQVPVYNREGDTAEQIELREDIFGLPFNEAVVHQAVVRQRANERQGTASTKTRGEVTGSTRKLFAQKHTGRARRGDIRSPMLRGGGVAFGPKPRSYRQAMPRKMRRLALKCVLSAKLKEGEMKVLEDFDFPQPRAKGMVDILSALGVDSRVLVITGVVSPGVARSVGNLVGVKVIPAPTINILDLTGYKILLLTVSAVQSIERIWGEGDN